MLDYAKPLPIAIAAILASALIPNQLLAETYVIKKLNTPTICINGQEMKVGDSFSDGAVVQWRSGSQAMRVLSGSNEVLSIRAAGNTKPARMRTLVASQSKLSTRALACTSLAEHKQAFEGPDNNGQTLLDTLTIASAWRQDAASYFEMVIKKEKGERIVQLPSNDNGEVMIYRSMFDINDADEQEHRLSVGIRYVNGAKGETRQITSSMNITILPPFKDI